MTFGLFAGPAAVHAGTGEHGIGATKGCAARCVGETTDCTATATFLDQFEDAIVIKDAWDEVSTGEGLLRVPASGNLPIIQVIGNAMCTDDGGSCNSATGANCVFPCTIGPSGSSVGGLPALSGAGRIRVAQRTYEIQDNDPANLADVVRFTWEDLCNSGEFNCPQQDLTTPAGSNTVVRRCNDGNGCTEDICTAGVCSFDADCTSVDDCDDDNECTTDVCTPDGCCENTQIICDDQDSCTRDSCNTDTGCVYAPIVCNDDNACTRDACVGGICVYTTITCDDQDSCTTDACVGGDCVYTPITCNDQDACTTDVCEGGVCRYTPMDCNDRDACTADTCKTGVCEHVRRTCNDNDTCTSDACDTSSGNCVYTPIEPPPPECAGGDGCTPGFWKQPHHLRYWAIYEPSDIYDDVFGVDAFGDLTLLGALQQGGGGKIALGRHSVAALLNATSRDVDYAFTVEAIIAMVQEAYATGDFEGAKNRLATENERGCTVVKSNDGRDDTTTGSKLNRGPR